MEGLEAYLLGTALIIVILIIFIICRALRIKTKFQYIYPGIYLLITLAGCGVLIVTKHAQDALSLIYVSGAPGSLLGLVVLSLFSHDMNTLWNGIYLSPLFGLLQYFLIGSLFDFIAGKIDGKKKAV